MNELPRVLLENYLMLSAALENQNLGRLQDMLQYQQKVHHNLVDIVQQIEDAPAVAMTTTGRQAQQPDTMHDPPSPDRQQDLQNDDPPAAFGQQQQHDQQMQVPTAGYQQQHIQALQQQQQAYQQQQQQLIGPQQLQHPQQQQQQQQQQAGPAWLANVNQPVHQLLQGLGLAQFVPLLEQQHVDMAALQLMEERHLRELGLPIGAVVKIKAALTTQQQ